jgi:hypothetical protein
MSEVHCSGNETSIARCPHRTQDENIVCDLEDAGVVCAMEPNERDNETPTCEACETVATVGGACVGVAAIGTIGAVIILLLVERKRMKKRRTPVPAEYSGWSVVGKEFM